MDEIVNGSERCEVALANDGAGSVFPQSADVTKANA